MAVTQTYTPVTDAGPLSVSEIYKELMQYSVGAESLYIRTKETLDSFLEKSTLPMDTRARILSEALVQMSTSITAQAMTAAVAIAKENRDGKYQLTKMREETLLIQAERDKMNQDSSNSSALTTAQTNKAVIEGWQIQSVMRKEDGTTVVGMNPSNNIILSDSAFTQTGLKDEQREQMRASVYATMAKSFRESGTITWTTDGATNKIDTITDLAPANAGLTNAQYNVAVRQEKAFDDNMLQHAANSSANMIGLIVSSEEAAVLNTDLKPTTFMPKLWADSVEALYQRATETTI